MMLRRTLNVIKSLDLDPELLLLIRINQRSLLNILCTIFRIFLQIIFGMINKCFYFESRFVATVTLSRLHYFWIWDMKTSLGKACWSRWIRILNIRPRMLSDSWSRPEMIEWFIEDQAFLLSYLWFGSTPAPSPSLSCQQIASLSRSSCLSPVQRQNS